MRSTSSTLEINTVTSKLYKTIKIFDCQQSLYMFLLFCYLYLSYKIIENIYMQVGFVLYLLLSAYVSFHICVPGTVLRDKCLSTIFTLKAHFSNRFISFFSTPCCSNRILLLFFCHSLYRDLYFIVIVLLVLFLIPFIRWFFSTFFARAIHG